MGCALSHAPGGGIAARAHVITGSSAPSTGSPTGPGPVDITRLNPHDPPPEALFNKLLDEGRVLPCEHYGPYNAEKFHNNTTGRYRGYCDGATFDADQACYETSVAKQTGWADIDTSIKDFNAEYLFFYGEINGRGLDMKQLEVRR